jgi:hypothetical protein
MSAVGNQFRGLDMRNLIGGPLTAAAEASVMLARSTADFINQVGFDSEQKTRNVLFKFNRALPDPDGNISQDEMAVEVPLLAIVPIPNLQIDEVNVTFDMEVKNSERSDSSTSMGASLSGGVKIGPVNISISGSVSSASSNTRSSDNSAKYHVSVFAANHGTPEGLARVLDMMATSVTPNLLSSRAVDSNGNELRGKDRERNRKLRELRARAFQLESAETSARDSFDLTLRELSRRADSARNQFQTAEQAKLNAGDPNSDEATKITSSMERNMAFWDEFKVSIRDTVIMASSSESAKKLDDLKGTEAKASGVTAFDTGIEGAFSKAIEAYGVLKNAEDQVAQNRSEFNNAMMDVRDVPALK